MINPYKFNEFNKNNDLSRYGSENVKNEGVENMKLRAKEIFRIEEGKHEGTIVHIIERKEPYEYCDLVIRLPDSNGTELKVGYPMSLSEASALGRLLERFGVKVIPAQEYEIEKVLMNAKVAFMTINEKTEKGTFARIIPESVKPL